MSSSRSVLSSGDAKHRDELTRDVQNVTIDGKPWKSNCFIEWDAFTNGSLIELQLTDDIGVSCGAGADAIPPSLSTGGYD